MDELVRDLLELKVHLLKLRDVDPDLRERIEKLCVAITEKIKTLESPNMAPTGGSKGTNKGAKS